MILSRTIVATLITIFTLCSIGLLYYEFGYDLIENQQPHDDPGMVEVPDIYIMKIHTATENESRTLQTLLATRINDIFFEKVLPKLKQYEKLYCWLLIMMAVVFGVYLILSHYMKPVSIEGLITSSIGYHLKYQIDYQEEIKKIQNDLERIDPTQIRPVVKGYFQVLVGWFAENIYRIWGSIGMFTLFCTFLYSMALSNYPRNIVLKDGETIMTLNFTKNSEMIGAKVVYDMETREPRILNYVCSCIDIGLLSLLIDFDNSINPLKGAARYDGCTVIGEFIEIDDIWSWSKPVIDVRNVPKNITFEILFTSKEPEEIKIELLGNLERIVHLKHYRGAPKRQKGNP